MKLMDTPAHTHESHIRDEQRSQTCISTDHTPTFTTESSGATDAMDVVLAVGGQVVVDDERHLLHVDASGQQIRGDQHAGGAGAELTLYIR